MSWHTYSTWNLAAAASLSSWQSQSVSHAGQSGTQSSGQPSVGQSSVHTGQDAKSSTASVQLALHFTSSEQLDSDDVQTIGHRCAGATPLQICVELVALTSSYQHSRVFNATHSVSNNDNNQSFISIRSTSIAKSLRLLYTRQNQFTTPQILL